jgi:hypothetical protein
MQGIDRISPVVWLCVLSLAIAACPANSVAEDAASASVTEAVIRARKPLSPTAVRLLAQHSAPKILKKTVYPDIPNFSPRQIITVLCGSFQQAYWDELLRLNDSASLSLDKPIGEKGFSVSWPACAYVETKPNLRYVVKEGDSAFSIFKNLTGSAATLQELKSYFSQASIQSLSDIKPGDSLSVSHITRPTPVRLDQRLVDNTATDSMQLSSDSYVTVSNTQQSKKPKTNDLHPVLQVAAGRISTDASAPYEPPDECRLETISDPFDAKKVRGAFAYSLARAGFYHIDQNSALVTVADNGFFGARFLDNGKLDFAPQFPERFFGTPAMYDGAIGPVVKDGAESIYPLNFSNSLTPDLISGHGTHVTGLILGGFGFKAFTGLFDRTPGKPWLNVTIINIGNGKATLTPNSEQQMFEQIGFSDGKIINLSIEYKSDVNGKIQNTFESLVTQALAAHNLFVVAAGNDANPDVSKAGYFPAALGGIYHSNVLTVAAHRKDGALASFTNRGRSSVDIAAPGCNLGSWISQDSKVAYISGTSQAAALATFDAALIRSLAPYAPVAQVKNRLFVSGDLLNEGKFVGKNSDLGPGELNPSPDQVVSRSRINMYKSLLIYDDYVRFRATDGTERELVGDVTGIPKITCSGDPPNNQDNQHDVWSFKASEIKGGGWLYSGRNNKKVSAPCEAKIPLGKMISMNARMEIKADGSMISLDPTVLTRIPSDALIDYVAKLDFRVH